jgi:solute:Na+ symporter, SSS family
MKNNHVIRISGFVLLVLMFIFAASVSAVSPVELKVGGIELPAVLPGRSVGVSGNALIIVGGIDADCPVSRVDVFEFSMPGVKGEWFLAELESPVAYGTAVTAGNQMIIIGGIRQGNVSGRVVSLEWRDGLLVETALPDLPEPRLFAGAGMLGSSLYVVGGISALDSTEPIIDVYSIDVSSDNPAWERCPDFPGIGRLNPTLSSVNEELHVFGGWGIAASADGTTVYDPLSDVWGYRAKPLDGTTIIGWKKLNDIPFALAESCAYVSSQTHIILIGGVKESCRGELPGIFARTGGLSDRVLIYHNVTDTWVEAGKIDSAQAGGSVLAVAGKEFIVNARDESGAVFQKSFELVIQKTVKVLATLDYGVMLVYFVLMGVIGLYFAKRQTSSETFSLGNRRVKWWAAAISMFATGASSISFMAIPAQSYRTNLVWLAPIFIILPMYYIQGYVAYPILRRLRITSTYEFLERRFSPSLRYIASIQCIGFQVLGRMSVVLLLPSLAISAVTGLNIYVSVLLMGILTTVYTTFGGFEAVIWTDVTQGILMLVSAAIIIFLGIIALPGGFSEFISTGEQFDKFKMFIWDMDYTLPVFWVFAIGLLFINLAFAGDQPVVQRVLATPLKDVRKLAAFFIFFSILIAFLVNFAGIAIFGYYHAFPDKLAPTMSNDQLVPLYIVQRFPAGLAGLIIAAIFAASMSTLSSSMNSVATLVSEDFYRKFKPKATDKSALFLMKFTSLFVGLFGTVIAVYMASMDLRSIFQTWNEITALLGGGFLGIYILGMFTTRATTAGSITGALASIVCVLYIRSFTPIHWTFYNPVAVLSCIVIGYLVSLLGKQKKDLNGLTAFTMIKGLEEDIRQ